MLSPAIPRRRSGGSDATVTWFSFAAWALALATYTWAVWTHSQHHCRRRHKSYRNQFLSGSKDAVDGVDVTARPFNEFDGCDPARWLLWGQRDAGGQLVPLVEPGSVTGSVTSDTSFTDGVNAEAIIADIVGEGPADAVDRVVYETFFSKDEGTRVRRGRYVEVLQTAFEGANTTGRENETYGVHLEKRLNWSGVVVAGRTPRVGGTLNRGKDMKILYETLCSNVTGAEAAQKSINLLTTMTSGAGTVCMQLSDVLDQFGIGSVDMLRVFTPPQRPNIALAVLAGLDLKRVHVRVLAIDVDGDGAAIREALLSEGLCLVRRVGRTELWAGDSVLRRLHCGWTAFRHEP